MHKSVPWIVSFVVIISFVLLGISSEIRPAETANAINLMPSAPMLGNPPPLQPKKNCPTCTDSDPFQDPFFAGIVKVTYCSPYGSAEPRTMTYPDYCDGNYVVQAYCSRDDPSSSDASLVGFTYTHCEYGCTSGICKYPKIFVTNDTFNGSLDGFRGADFECMSAAAISGLGGMWKAWLSNGTVDARTRMVQSPIPYERVDGVRIANNWNDLTDGTLQNPISVNELGRQVDLLGAVWTGTDFAGVSFGPNCDSWHNSLYTAFGESGYHNATDARWTVYSMDHCSYERHLYCVQQPTWSGYLP